MSASALMVAAGGTGGHLFPAQALAEQMQARGYTVDLITDMRGDRYGVGFPARAIHRVPAATLTRRTPWGAATTGIALARGVFEARAVLRKVRPACVAGFGGYPTVPPLLAAMLLGIPTLLHEQNAVMGRANRMLARFATAVALTFEETRLLPPRARARARVTGNPVRGAVIEAARTPYVPPPPEGRLHLVVFGGSQGARFFSEALPQAVALMPEAMRRRLAVVQQARAEDLEEVRAAYARTATQAELAPFFTDLAQRLAQAHLVIARAGASTVAELCVLGRPAILVPFPHALDNDQLENATRIDRAGGGWCLRQTEATPQKLADMIGQLVHAPHKLHDAARRVRDLGRPDAVERLADLVEELAIMRRR